MAAARRGAAGAGTARRCRPPAGAEQSRRSHLPAIRQSQRGCQTPTWARRLPRCANSRRYRRPAIATDRGPAPPCFRGPAEPKSKAAPAGPPIPPRTVGAGPAAAPRAAVPNKIPRPAGPAGPAVDAADRSLPAVSAVAEQPAAGSASAPVPGECRWRPLPISGRPSERLEGVVHHIESRPVQVLCRGRGAGGGRKAVQGRNSNPRYRDAGLAQGRARSRRCPPLPPLPINTPVPPAPPWPTVPAAGCSRRRCRRCRRFAESARGPTPAAGHGAPSHNPTLLLMPPGAAGARPEPKTCRRRRRLRRAPPNPPAATSAAGHTAGPPSPVASVPGVACRPRPARQ